jgi:hypothetical protein
MQNGAGDIIGAAGSVIGIIIASIFFAIIYFGIIAFYIICMWKIFVKAGRPGWAALIPFYNIFIEIEIAGLPWWVFLLVFIPGANAVALILISINLANVFSKSTGFAVGLIFLGFVFIPILAFDDSKYIAPVTGQVGTV